MASYFTFNGVSSKDMELKCKEINHFSFAAKSYESIKIPGRTGNLLIDDGSYENKMVPVVAYLDLRNVPIYRPIIDYDPETKEPIYGENRLDKINKIKGWLIGHTGYKALTFDDLFEYQATVNGQVEITELFTDYFQLSIEFECIEVIE